MKKYVLIQLWNNYITINSTTAIDDYNIPCIDTGKYRQVVKRKKDSKTIYYGTKKEYLKKYPLSISQTYEIIEPIYDNMPVIGEIIDEYTVKELITGKTVVYSSDRFKGELSYQRVIAMSEDNVLSNIKKLTKEDIERYTIDLSIIENKSKDIARNHQEHKKRKKVPSIKFKKW